MAIRTASAPTAALTPPPGVLPDMEHQPNLLWRFNIIAQIVCMTVAGTLFFLRCYVRLGLSRMSRQWLLEDWMVCLSFVGLTIYSALIGIMMNNHAGVHIWDLTQEQADRVLYYFWIESIIYGPLIFFTKLSILLLYLRLLVPTRWSLLWTKIHIFISISAAFYTALTLVKIFQCQPQAKAYHKSMPGRCINIGVLLIVSGLFNTTSDALILLVPIKACWTLKMTWQKKVAVCAVFTIGAVAPIFSGIGFACRVRTAANPDLTYNQPLILLWGTAEVTTGVICACLPCLPPLIRHPNRKLSTTPIPTNSSSPSRHEGSTHSYPQNKDFRYGAYIELEDSSKVRARVEELTKEVVTTVKGGASPMDSLAGRREGFMRDSKLEGNRRRNGVIGLGGYGSGQEIVRTVTVEQTGGF